MEAGVEEERELGQVAFEMASESFLLEIKIAFESSPIRSDILETKYWRFQRTASKLGIDLPDQPPEATTSRSEMDTFLQNQIAYAKKCVAKLESEHIREMYCTGHTIQTLKFTMVIILKNQGREKDEAMQRLKSDIKSIEKTGKQLDIDISEELRKVNEFRQLKSEEIDELLEQLTEKFRTRKQAEKKRSEIDPTRIITNDNWVISLVRLPDSSHGEHAFLVLEGKTGNKSMIRFTDFVANDAFDLLRADTRDGKVRMDYHDSEAVPGSSSKLLFRCRKNLMKIRYGDRLLYKTWSISKATAEKLLQNIEAQQNNPPKYNILGDSALAASSATSSSNPTGHNCFTFARMMLRDLNDESIEIPEDKLDKWIVSAASRFLSDKHFNSQRSLYSPLVIFLAGAVIAFLFLKLINL